MARSEACWKEAPLALDVIKVNMISDIDWAQIAVGHPDLPKKCRLSNERKMIWRAQQAAAKKKIGNLLDLPKALWVISN